MEEEMRTLNFYGVESDMIVHILDLNPNSIHKEIENIGQIEKYMMSEETYDSLPESFRKWKKEFLLHNPHLVNPLNGQVEICDPDHLKTLAETMQVGQRCQLENGARGEIRFIGRALEVGYGYFIGIELDEAVGDGGNGTIEGMHYFFGTEGHAIFVRPNKVEVGDFPKIEESDEI
jgi:tubulin-folding cofactor B